MVDGELRRTPVRPGRVYELLRLLRIVQDDGALRTSDMLVALMQRSSVRLTRVY
jgi:hypothetical protein